MFSNMLSGALSKCDYFISVNISHIKENVVQ